MSVGKTTRKALPFSNVVATGDATSQITVGKTINNFQLELGGTSLTKAMINMFRLKANAKTIFEGSGTQIDKINAYRGLVTNPAYLDISFEDLTGLDIIDRVVGCLDTSAGIASLNTEVSIAGATAPTLKGILYETARQTDAAGNVSLYAGLMAKQLRYPFSVASGGQLPLNFPFGAKNGALIKRVHVFHTNMIGATVKEDGIVIHESTDAQRQYEQARMGRTPQAGMYTIDFVVDGDMRKAFDTRNASSVEWLFDFSAADNGYIVIEYLDVLGNL
jgi:hypothetical protein